MDAFKKLKPGIGTVLTLAVFLALLKLVLLVIFYNYLFPYERVGPPKNACESEPKPHLIASGGDGEVTLTWRLPKVDELRFKGWQYEQSEDGGAEVLTHGTGSKSMRYVVPDLANGVAYWFRVRPILESGWLDCWSNRVGAVPRVASNALDAIERHHKDMAGHASAISAAVAANRELGERAARAAEKTAASMEAVAESLTAIKSGMGDLSGSVAAIGNEVVAGFARIERQLAKMSGGMAQADFCEREKIGSLFFEHDSYRLSNCAGNAGERGNVRNILDKLNGLKKDSLILVEGHASAAGSARYNLHLSDLRAACAIQCLRDRLDELHRLKFRALVRGESFDGSDPLGNGPQSRRADVFQCGDFSHPAPSMDALPEVQNQPLDCGCPM